VISAKRNSNKSFANLLIQYFEKPEL